MFCFYVNNKKYNYSSEFNNFTKKSINNWKNHIPLLNYLEVLGLNIPHYCFHKDLSVAGNCRMCLIELKNAPKPVVSCAISAKSCLKNASIFTNSPLIKKSRENILEFLLLNHPLDCPICDQGGECDLQDQSLFFGLKKKRFYNYKRFVKNKNLGPVIKTVMTRCIHCTRCVRFATEIAGVEDLGVFGRGLHSEIGTYVNKTFQSELSGNVIDLCPVGALTSKPYPFTTRKWELKVFNVLDFSDGYLSNIQLFLKNNALIKITPNFNKNFESTWISNKIRFSFDSISFFLTDSKKKLKTPVNYWVKLNKKILILLYFNDHLIKHCHKINNIFVVLYNNISLELINLLYILEQTYSFIKLRKPDAFNINTDLENNFLMNNKNSKKTNLNTFNFCFLINLNSRYESYVLNLKLRKRYLAGNFKIFSLSSLINITLPLNYLNINYLNIKIISEGNNVLCQQLYKKKLILISNVETFKRKDGNSLELILKNLLLINSKFKLDILNSSMTNSMLNYYKNPLNLNVKDVENNCGLYFINIVTQLSNIKKFLELKILNFLINKSKYEFTIEQNNVKNNYFNMPKMINYLTLPTKTFFETNSIYLNTEGIFKQNPDILSLNSMYKEDWQILRKLINNSKKINFYSYLKTIPKIFNSISNKKKILNFVSFNYTTVLQLNNTKTFDNIISFIDLKNIKKIYKNIKKKFYKTNFFLWIEDFYLRGKDSYSLFSVSMLKCSQDFRLNSTNFKLL